MKTPPQKKQRKRRSPSLPNNKPLHFLIVEDEPSHAELIRRGLLSYDNPYRLTVTTSLAGARDLISTDPPDLIILDWLLPDGKGEELLPENPDSILFPVIVMTSYGDNKLAAQILQRGAIDYLVKGKPFFDDLPHIAERALQTWKNLQSQKILEGKLIAQESVLRALVNNPADSIVLLDSDGTILDLNTTMADHLGMHTSALIGTCIFDYFPKNLASSRRRHIKTVFETGTVARFDDERDGRWYDNILQPVMDSTGKVTQVVIVAHDVSEVKKVELNLLSTQQELKELHRIAHIGTWTWKIENNTVTWSEELYKIAGWDLTKKAPTFEEMPRLYTPESWEILNRAVKTALATGKQYNLELEMVRPDGTVRWTQVFGGVIEDSNGEVTALHGTVQDITERKRTDESQRMNEARLNTAMDIGNMAWWEMDLPGGEVRFDDRKAAMLGYPSDRFHHYSDFTALLHPNDFEPTMQAMRDHLCGNLERYCADYRIRTADGKFRWLRDVGGITKWHTDGTPSTVTGIVIDITAGKHAEEALYESEERYRTLVEELPDLVIVQRQGELVYVNAAVSRLLGSSGVNVIHTSIFDYIMPESRETIVKAMETRGGGRNPLPYVVKITVPDGSIRWVEIRGADIMYEGLPATLNVLTDVTEKKWAEEAIFASEQKFRTLADYTFDWEYWIGPDEKYIYITPSCERITGFTPDEFYYNKNLLDDLIVPEDRDKFRTHNNQETNSPDPGFIEFRIRTKEDNIIWIGHICHPIYNADGKYLGRRGSNRDITQRKMAEEALHQEEAKYRRIYETAFEGIWGLDEGFHIQFVNPMMARLLGYSIEEIIGHHVSEFIVPDDKGDAEQHFELRKKGLKEQFERRYKRKDGSIITLLVSASPIIGDDRKFKGSFAMFTDITDRKQAEEALRESETRFRLLIQNASDMIRILGYDRKIVYESPSSEPILGYPTGTLIGKNPLEYIHPDDRERVKSDFQRVIERKNLGIPTEFRIRKADGTYIWVDSIGVNLFGVPGIDGIVITTRPIEERKEMERSLQESEERFRDIFNLSPVGIALTDEVGNILEMNDAMLDTFGYSPGEVRRMNTLELYALPDERRNVIEIVLAKGQILDYEVLLKRADGSTFPGILNATRILRKGKILLQSSIIDISDRKMMEEEIRSLNRALEQRVRQRTDDLNASLAEKEILLREIHHRVKNNLQIIISILRLQKRQITDPRTLEILLDCESRVRSMALVHEKLYRSADLAHIDIGDYLRTLTNYLFTTYSIDQKQVTFHVEITTLALDINRAIPVGLILNELVSNSLKHAFPEGRDGKIEITGGQEEENIVISIQDNGIGIPVDFDWRHTLSLGMHLIMTLVEQVNGTIELTDRNEGTHFTIRIPRDSRIGGR